MRFEILFVVLFYTICTQAATTNTTVANSKVICYYNGTNFIKEGLGKVTITDIEPALSMCTHLVYGYAGIKAENSKLTSLNENLDLDQGKGHYRMVTSLKTKFPHLKILLSIGGGADADKEKYMTLLESSATRSSFIYSVYGILKSYSFDGLDLAWQFPVVKPKKIRSSVGSVWHKFKKTFSGDSIVDLLSEQHRDQFTELVKEIHNQFHRDEFELGVTILPNVNASLYMNVPAIIDYLDYVIVSAFDQQTPDRNPKEADYPAPIYVLNDRNPKHNVDAEIAFWISNKAPPSKVVLGIATYGRAWNLNDDSGDTGVPPLLVEGAAPEGNESQLPGLLSWPEICAKLPNNKNELLKGENAPLRKVGDPTKRFGSYAFRVPDSDGKHGLWIGYDDPDTAGNKADYVKLKHLGGVAVFDLGFDDFRGSCGIDKFPILKSIKSRL